MNVTKHWPLQNDVFAPLRYQHFSIFPIVFPMLARKPEKTKAIHFETTRRDTTRCDQTIKDKKKAEAKKAESNENKNWNCFVFCY